MDGSVDGDQSVQRLKSIFECPICGQLTTDGRFLAETSCQHTYCLKCIVDWQRKCSEGLRPFSCPSCRLEQISYQHFQWPKLVIQEVFEMAQSMDSRQRSDASRVHTLQEQYKTIEKQLKDIAEQRNELVREKDRIQHELEVDKRKQEELQQLLDGVRAHEEATLKSKDTEMRKLQSLIEALEREKRMVGDAELAAAKARMRDLENDKKDRETREVVFRTQIQDLEEARARHLEELKERDAQLESLKQLRNNVLSQSDEKVDIHNENNNNNNNNNHHEAPSSPPALDDPQSPLYESIVVGEKWVKSVWNSPIVSGSVQHGGRALKAVTNLMFRAFSARGSQAALLCDEASYALMERRGNHYASPVWRAAAKLGGSNDDEDAEFVAVKFRRADRDAYREAMLLHKLEHPNLIGLLGVFKSQTRPGDVGLVLPFVELDLEFWLASETGPNVLKKRDRIVHELVAAVAYMHRNNVVHRCLAPCSVLLELRPDSTLQTRVASWSCAASLASSHLPPVIARGTRYRAPEMGLEEQVADWKAIDIWAVGAIVWELLTRTNEEHWPLVGDGRPTTLIEQLVSWTELRAAASAQSGDHLEVKQALKKEPRRSMMSQLERALLNEETRSLVGRLLAWNPRERIPMREALLLLSSAAGAGTQNVGEDFDALGHFVDDPRSLSDAALPEWISQHVEPNE